MKGKRLMMSNLTRIALVAVLMLIVIFGACIQAPPSQSNQNQAQPASTKPAKAATTIGVYRPSNTTFYLRNNNTPGEPDAVIPYGPKASVPVVGDWDGDGTTTIGVYTPNEGRFYLRNSNSNGNADVMVDFGPKGSVPIVGDWDGNGTTTIGVYVPSQ